MSPSISRALVVGGTGGIGYAIACRIAAETKSASVIVSGRNKPDKMPHDNMEFRKLDASSMRAIKTYTDAYKAAQQPKIDLLVLTQGILTVAGRTETSEGIDRKMALHFYGRQLLIRELLPVLKDDAKVLIVLDAVNGNRSKLDWSDLDLKNTFSIANAATHCLAMTDGMIQQWAATQGSNSTAKRHFTHAYPGLVTTDIFKSLPIYLRLPAQGLAFLGTSPDDCAKYLVDGTYKVADADEKEDRFWSCINQKGVSVAKKEVWPEEDRKKVMEHAWKIVDDAIASS
jgi:NAD(P)-dependent dehydrogenase (short-subunit alcohol dehydrogenase family)